PSDHPLFAAWSAAEIAAARRKLEISVDGRVVLSAALQCYPSRPWDLQVGITGFDSDSARPRFSGRVLALEKMPVIRDAQLQRELVEGVESLAFRLYAKLGEELIFNSEYSFQPGANLPTAFGWNRIGSGAAAAEFSGRILEIREMDWSILPAKPYRGQFGAVE